MKAFSAEGAALNKAESSLKAVGTMRNNKNNVLFPCKSLRLRGSRGQSNNGTINSSPFYNTGIRP